MNRREMFRRAGGWMAVLAAAPALAAARELDPEPKHTSIVGATVHGPLHIHNHHPSSHVSVTNSVFWVRGGTFSAIDVTDD